ncbi:hypothetical protein BKG82_26695 [Mycobacteroides chelonae]|uniref:Uncharacterized protein n=1 Tax=Mycobacteroides chelonae TaxID=1774 RepID=A0A1S1LIK1_MYCCH|nr:hypothetical protein [Mycobacteroides chelonae]OHU47246.1 hypothetical protein BKG82_26695 [Mycobacteroides chelonae]
MIPIPIVIPSGSSGAGGDPDAETTAWVAIALGALTGAALLLRWAVHTRTTDFLCALPHDDPRFVRCDKFAMSAYDMIHDCSGFFGWVMFAGALILGLVAGPFLASRKWLKTSGMLVLALYSSLACWMLVVPTPGPEYLDPIRVALLAVWAASLIAYLVWGLCTAVQMKSAPAGSASVGDG